MDIAQLRYISAIYKYRNLTKAASVLHVTQPLLSQQLRAIEKELGLSLFERTTRSINPTPEGVLFCTQAQNVEEEYDKLVRLANQQRIKDANALRMLSSARLRAIELPRAISDFYSIHDSISIRHQDLDAEDISGTLMDEIERWDIAVFRETECHQVLNSQGFECRKLLADPVEVLCHDSHPLTRQSSVSYDDLLNYKIVCGDPDGYFYQELASVFPELDLSRLNMLLFSNSHDVMAEMVRNGQAVSIGNRSLARYYGFSSVPFSEPRSNDVYLLRSAGNTKKIQKDLWNYLIDFYKDW